MTCLEHTEKAHQMAEKGIATIRQLLKNHEMAIHSKEHYRKQMRMLRQIAKETKREAKTIKSLILKLQGSMPHHYEINGYAPKA
jgi:DNA replication protein DnaC